MVKKTFVLEKKVDNLIELIQINILEIKGEILFYDNEVVKWKYFYGKQILECNTYIYKNEIVTEAQNLGNISVGEGIVVNRFFNALMEKLISHEKKKLIAKRLTIIA